MHMRVNRANCRLSLPFSFAIFKVGVGGVEGQARVEAENCMK